MNMTSLRIQKVGPYPSILVEWLIDYCLMSSKQYFSNVHFLIYFHEENKFRINN